MPKNFAHRLLTRAAQKLVLCSFAMAVAAWGATASIDPGLFLDDVKFLASKNLKGRGTGTPELEKAAAFIAAKFRSFGLEPIDGKSYPRAVKGKPFLFVLVCTNMLVCFSECLNANPRR